MLFVYHVINRWENKMTNRIQQIAEQAKKQVPAGLLVDQWIAKYNEIFARLIIDECVMLIHLQDRIPKEFFYAKPAFIHEGAIKRHFGIEDEV